MESNPRKAFFGMFGQGDTKEEREAILSTTAACSTTCGNRRQPEPQARCGDRAR